ncbi:MAG: fibronectin type III domain-containing protein, partial [Bacteroidetes bacterium]|nr:fibronectin type III domain-containing protein [Bacteroidota bacterium]
MRLTWSRASEDEERFEIGRRDTGKDWIIVHTVAAGKEEILDGELSAETTYGYRIRAVNEAGASEWSDPVEVTTPALPVPDTPFGVMAKATGPTSISITWIMPYPSCEQSFELEESLTGDENDFTAVLPAPGAGDRSYQRDGLQPQTTYYYRLRAVNTSGMSDYSGIASATTLKKDERLPDTPFDVIASALSESRIRISWAMPDPMPAEGFSLER